MKAPLIRFRIQGPPPLRRHVDGRADEAPRVRLVCDTIPVPGDRLGQHHAWANQWAADESKFIRISETTLSPQDLEGFAEAWRQGNLKAPPGARVELLAAPKDIRGRPCAPLPPAPGKNFPLRPEGIGLILNGKYLSHLALLPETVRWTDLEGGDELVSLLFGVEECRVAQWRAFPLAPADDSVFALAMVNAFIAY